MTTQPADPAVVGGSAIARLALAQDGNTEPQTLWQLIDDANTTVANTARDRLKLALRPLTPAGAPA